MGRAASMKIIKKDLLGMPNRIFRSGKQHSIRNISRSQWKYWSGLFLASTWSEILSFIYLWRVASLVPACKQPNVKLLNETHGNRVDEWKEMFIRILLIGRGSDEKFLGLNESVGGIFSALSFGLWRDRIQSGMWFYYLFKMLNIYPN